MKTTQTALHEIVTYLDTYLRIQMYEKSYITSNLPHTGNWHVHKEVELLVVLEGHLQLETIDNTYILHSNQVCILGSLEPHRCIKPYQQSLRYLVLQFDPSIYFDPSNIIFLNLFLSQTQPLSRISPQLNHEQIIPIIKQLYYEIEQGKPGHSIALSGGIRLLLWTIISRQQALEAATETSLAYLEKLQPALIYIENHLQHKIKIEDISRVLNFSYDYCSKLFTKQLGVSFISYVNYRRIKQAERLLLTTDLTLLQIGEQVGIPSSGQFHTLFKKYHQCSPKQFRDVKKQ